MHEKRAFPKRVKKQKQVSVEVEALARELCVLYYAALKQSMQAQTRGSRGGLTVSMVAANYDDIDKDAQRYFRRAAIACSQVAAEPREFITAQFKRWAELSQLKNKILLPMPAHLGSVGAQARFIQFKLQKGERRDRSVLPERAHTKSFFTEDRKLAGLMRVLRQPEEEVLTERPEEFTRQYLEHKRVWSLVKVTWHDRQLVA